MNVNGRWEGKLLDMLGPTAMVVLNLRNTGRGLGGDFSVSFLPPEGGGCCGSHVGRQAQSGSVAGRLDARGTRMRLDYTMTIDFKPVEVAFECTVVNADPHARRAMFGVYRVANGSESLSLQGGACVLWLYADQGSKGQ